MAAKSHQTVRIARGRHSSPADGACAMELASMLAGEKFSDRPRCVDPVIGAYVRALNDRLPDADRQRLLPYAAACVGTRAGRATARRRMRLCLEAAGVANPGRLPARAAARLRVAVLIGAGVALRLRDGGPEWAVRELMARGDVPGAFDLLDRLIGSEATPLAVAVVGVPQVGGTARADLVAEPQRT